MPPSSGQAQPTYRDCRDDGVDPASAARARNFRRDEMVAPQICGLKQTAEPSFVQQISAFFGHRLSYRG